MALRVFILLGFLSVFTSNVLGQYGETIRTARPGASFGAYTLGARVFQVQTGVTYDWKNDRDSDTKGNGIGYLLSLRYGPTETFEVRAAFAARRDKITDQSIEDSFGGLDLINVGFRWNVIDGKGSGPALSFQQDFRLNFGTSEVYRFNYTAPRTLALFSMPLTSWLSLTSNLGILWDGQNPGAIGYYTLNLGFPVTDRISSFVEVYGRVNDAVFGTNFDTGFGYLVNNDLQLDISFGIVELGDNAAAYFVDGGVSWRMRFKKEGEE